MRGWNRQRPYMMRMPKTQRSWVRKLIKLENNWPFFTISGLFTALYAWTNQLIDRFRRVPIFVLSFSSEGGVPLRNSANVSSTISACCQRLISSLIRRWRPTSHGWAGIKWYWIQGYVLSSHVQKAIDRWTLQTSKRRMHSWSGGAPSSAVFRIQ